MPGKKKIVEVLHTDIGLANPSSTKKALKKNVSDISSIYLFNLGIVGDLRDRLNISVEIPDEYIVLKYGLSCDLLRRTAEHEARYAKIFGIEKVKLQFYKDVVKFKLAEAENVIATSKNKVGT